MFIYGSVYNGSIISYVGKYKLINNKLVLSEYNKINDAKIIPEYFTTNTEAILELEEINHLNNKYGLKEKNTNDEYIINGIENELYDEVYVKGIKSKKIFDFATTSIETLVYITPDYDDILDNDFKINKDTFIVLLAETITDGEIFYYCDIQVDNNSLSKIYAWIPKKNITITGF